jgi:hypothetical protein
MRRWIIVLLGALMFPALAAAESIPEREFRGRIVCLPEEMHRIHQTDLPARHEHIWALRASDGTYYTLLRTQFSEAIFLDERIRKRDLLLKGRVLPKTQVLDVTSMKSVINGVVNDLYYWCDICAIHSVSPSECACCQGPVELKEEPIK